MPLMWLLYLVYCMYTAVLYSGLEVGSFPLRVFAALNMQTAKGTSFVSNCVLQHIRMDNKRQVRGAVAKCLLKKLSLILSLRHVTVTHSDEQQTHK